MASSIKDLLDVVVCERLRASSVSRVPNELIDSESDKGRVVNSSAFRRLQQKAQVFPLDENAAVRTRLTHSIEVSQVGRYLAQKVIEKSGYEGEGYYKLAALVNIVETSCLIHDIGNPPFGHLGEAAIRNWFKSNKQGTGLDFFDGNPQGFRIVSFLSGKDEYGLNLTTSLLLASVKYPWRQKDAYESAPEKSGLFDYEYEKYEKACESISWKKGKKFPLAILMEAADDIAYCTSDLEDGLEKGVIKESELNEIEGYLSDPKGPVDSFVSFKTKLIRDAVETAAGEFVDKVDRILNGEDVKLIPEGSHAGKKIETIRGFARKHIYSNEEVEKIELAGNSAITGILDHFYNLLNLDISEFRYFLDDDYKAIKRLSLEFEYRVFKRLPRSYVEKYKVMRCVTGNESEARNHLVADFISGMTDDFAISIYQVLHGIKVK